MPHYRLKIISAQGDIRWLTLEGHSKEAIMEPLVAQGARVLQSRKAFRWRLRPGGALSFRSFLVMVRQLSGLLRSGMNVSEALNILERHGHQGESRKAARTLALQVASGRSLSQSFATMGARIPRDFPVLIQAGEQSGQLHDILDFFCKQADQTRLARKRFRAALTYPLLLLGLSIIALYVILGQAIPEFASLYDASGNTLPLLTRGVIALSEMLRRGYLWLLGGALLVFVLGILLFRNTEGRLFLERLLVHVPFLGPLIFQSAQHTFLGSLMVLLKGGVTIPAALRSCVGISGSFRIDRALKAAIEGVDEGFSLGDALERGKTFHPLIPALIRMGEEGGILPEMLHHLNLHFQETIEDGLERVSSLAAPVFLIGIGSLIALMVLAMYLPMFGVSNLIGQ
jgi:type II secretory pathway component PulF